MGRKKILETIVVPRDYGFAVTDKRTGFKYLLFPERFVRADILTKTPGERRAQLRAFLANPANEQFLENLVANDFASVQAALEKRIKAREEVYTLWRVRKEEVVNDYQFYGDILSGRIRTIRHGKIKGLYRGVKIGTPWRIASGVLADYYETSSSDVEWSVVKGSAKGEEKDAEEASELERRVRLKEERRVRVIDLAAATLLTEMAKKEKDSKFLPFYFFDSPDLEIRVMKAHYVDGVKYFDIDKGLIDLKEIINPELVERTLAGKATVEVLRQRTRVKRCENRAKIDAEASLRTNQDVQFRRDGFVKVGTSLELKGTEYEDAGTRWLAVRGPRKGDICVTLFYDNIPPLVIIKRRPSERRDADFFYKEGFGGNPLESLGFYKLWFDDMTRQMMNCQITIPWAAIPTILKEDYRSLINKNCPNGRVAYLLKRYKLDKP